MCRRRDGSSRQRTRGPPRGRDSPRPRLTQVHGIVFAHDGFDKATMLEGNYALPTVVDVTIHDRKARDAFWGQPPCRNANTVPVGAWCGGTEYRSRLQHCRIVGPTILPKHKITSLTLKSLTIVPVAYQPGEMYLRPESMARVLNLPSAEFSGRLATPAAHGGRPAASALPGKYAVAAVLGLLQAAVDQPHEAFIHRHAIATMGRAGSGGCADEFPGNRRGIHAV